MDLWHITGTALVVHMHRTGSALVLRSQGISNALVRLHQKYCDGGAAMMALHWYCTVNALRPHCDCTVIVLALG